ncbi:MAG: hypothetical protein FWH57_08405 [Oscillospiraceae bacterium]|nr:hypothetical protein [Oscillospiraceae bacterium]
MTKEKRIIEFIKTALIALLSVSALILAWQTGLFAGFIDSIPFFGSVAELVKGASTATETSGAAPKEAARPISIVVTNEDGERYGAKYDTNARNAAYDRISSILGEALGSASTPNEISEDEWREALSGTGVFFEYLRPIRLSILDHWFGVNLPDTAKDVFIRYVCIAFGEDKSRIYYQDAESGSFFGVDTASAAGKAQELEIFSGNGAMFAFETRVWAADSAPYMLIMPESGQHPDVIAAAASSADELLYMVITALGHSEEKYTTYYDGRGALVGVGTQFNINVFSNGKVFYRRTNELPLDNETIIQDTTMMIERAREIVSNTIIKTCGAAEVFFESAEYGADGSYSVVFDYYIAGGRMFLRDDNNAARIKFSSGIISEIELLSRNYTLADEYTNLLPEELTLAAAGGEFLLSYSDAGAETLQPSWAKYFWLAQGG